MIRKRVLVLDRVRRPPESGFSWVDRRFLHEFAPALSHDAIVIYLFLAAVADKHGLSYWKAATIAGRLKLEDEAVGRARAELARHDLVACAGSLTQVLSVPQGRRQLRRSGGGPRFVGEILRRMMERNE